MQCVSEDNCRHRPRRVSKQVSLYFSIFVDFASIFLRRIGPFRNVACYHLATAREMASHPSVHSHHKALSAIVACIASVSARVRRESWDESKKNSFARAITRLETLATQASAIAERLPREFKGKAALSRRLRLFFSNFPFFPFC